MRVIVHAGLVQVGDAQCFLHAQNRCRYAATSRIVRMLILHERAIHPAVIGMELSQGKVRLHHVERRSRRTGALSFRGHKRFERRLRRRQRLSAGLANREWILVPVGWFGEGLQDGFGLEEPADVDHVLHAGFCGQGAGCGGVHAPIRRIGIVDHLEDRESRGDLHHRTHVPWCNALERVSQYGRQRRQPQSAQEPAGGGGRIDRFGLGQRDEVLSRIQPRDDPLRLLRGVDDDDSQRDFAGGRQLCGLNRKLERARSHLGSRQHSEDQQPDRTTSDVHLEDRAYPTWKTRWARRPPTACGTAGPARRV